jgi:alpha-amylase
LVEVCLVFEVHQPYRINRRFRIEEAENKTDQELFDLYFDNQLNREIFQRVAEKCYLPATKTLLESASRNRRDKRPFKFAFSFSGIYLEQCQRWCPQLLSLYKDLFKTGCLELVSQTYFHSLSSIFYENMDEFKEQVRQHVSLMKELMGAKPSVFENTELIYNNLIARAVFELGFKGIITEGSPKIMAGRSPHRVYNSKGIPGLKVLLRDYSLSDDIGFRFSARWWEHYPLTAEKYASWIAKIAEPLVLIFVDYETFGEHHWPESGIHEFLRLLPDELLKHDSVHFSTPSELVANIPSEGELDVYEQGKTVSWADTARDLSPWLGNEFQRASFNAVRLMGTNIPEGHYKRLWRYLQTSDHYYYMYTGFGGPAEVHSYFAGPLGSPSDLYRVFSSIWTDLLIRATKRQGLVSVVEAEIKGNKSRAFQFWLDEYKVLNIKAMGLKEFTEVIKTIDRRSIEYHSKRGDFENWIEGCFGDPVLARALKDTGSRLQGEDLRKAMVEILEKRVRELERIVRINEK